MLRESAGLGETLASIDRKVREVISLGYTELFDSRVAPVIISEPRILENVSSFKTDEDGSNSKARWITLKRLIFTLN